MGSNKGITSRQVTSAIMALAVTLAVHASWLAGMDRDAVAVIAATQVA